MSTAPPPPPPRRSWLYYAGLIWAGFLDVLGDAIESALDSLSDLDFDD